MTINNLCFPVFRRPTPKTLKWNLSHNNPHSSSTPEEGGGNGLSAGKGNEGRGSHTTEMGTPRSSHHHGTTDSTDKSFVRPGSTDVADVASAFATTARGVKNKVRVHTFILCFVGVCIGNRC